MIVNCWESIGGVVHAGTAHTQAERKHSRAGGDRRGLSKRTAGSLPTLRLRGSESCPFEQLFIVQFGGFTAEAFLLKYSVVIDLEMFRNFREKKKKTSWAASALVSAPGTARREIYAGREHDVKDFW